MKKLSIIVGPETRPKLLWKAVVGNFQRGKICVALFEFMRYYCKFGLKAFVSVVSESLSSLPNLFRYVVEQTKFK